MAEKTWTTQELFKAASDAMGGEAPRTQRGVATRLAAALGLRLAPEIPRRITSEHGTVKDADSGEIITQGSLAFPEIIRRFNAVAEALEFAETTDMPSAYHRAHDLLRILRDGGRP